MTLLDKQHKPAFETSEDSGPPTPVLVAAVTAATVTAPQPTAVAVAAASGALTPSIAASDVVATLKNAMPVDYNTLASIKCTNGNFVDRETNQPLGDTIVFELMSWQDTFVASPNDDKAPKDYVAFSDDGIYDKRDNQPLAEKIAQWKEEGYSKSGIKQRMVVVGAIQQASKTDKYNDTPVQLDLSPETRVLFQRYQALAAYGIRVGKLQPAQVLKIKAVCRLVTKGTNTYTVADFSVAS